MDNWDEIRTAYQVARIGTVSGAADTLWVHHATVIRHVDALEQRLGVKLFQRHARGYTATEAGQDLLQVAKATDDQFSQLAGRIRGQGEGVSGDLVVTSLAGLAPLFTPILAEFQRQNEGLTVRYLTGDRVFRLEYGEAHVAIRAGRAPEEPDNVVQPFRAYPMKLVAAQSYVDRYGKPDGEADLGNHFFVAHDNTESRAPFMQWLRARVPENRLTFRTMDNRSMKDAILAGAGIGFLQAWEFAHRSDMVEILPPQEDWNAAHWIVTHVDLHRTPKVQAFLKHLKAAAQEWVV